MSDSPATDVFSGWKAWYKSKTIWGILIATVATLVKVLFPAYTGDIQEGTDVILEEGTTLAQGVDAVYVSVVQLIGLAVAAWGRFKASVAIK